MNKIITITMTLLSSFASAQNQNTKDIAMENYKTIQKPSIVIIGIECRTSNAPDKAPLDIPLHWGKFYSEGILNKIPNKTSNEVIALYCDYEGDHTKPYSFVIGSPVSSLTIIPEGMVAKTLPATSYAVFNAIGEHPKKLVETWGEVWKTTLDRTYTGDFEIYGEKFTSGSPQEVEVLIAIGNKKN